MKQILTLLFTFIVLFLNAQSNKQKIDSLELQLLKSHGKEWVDIANLLCNEYESSNFDLAIHLIDDAIKLSNGIGYNMGETKSLFTKGEIHLKNDDPRSAIILFQESAIKYKELMLYGKMAEAIDFLSACLIDIKKYTEAEILIDSTLKNYYDATTPKTKSNLYGLLSSIYRQGGHKQKAIIAIDSAIAIETKNDLKKDLAKSYNSLGIIYSETGNYKKCLHYYNLSENTSRILDDTLRVAFSFYNQALVYYDKGIYEESLKLLFDASGLFLSINKESANINILAALGLIYHEMGKIELGKRYYITTIEQADFYNDLETKYITYHNLGELYFEINQYDSALYFYNGALRYEIENGSDLGVAETKNAIATLFIAMEKYNMAFSYFNEVEYVFNKYDFKKGLASLYSESAFGYQKLKNDSLSVLLFNKSIALSLKLSDRKNLMNTYERASENYERLDMLENALIYYKSYKKYNDTLFNEKSTTAIDFMFTKLNNQEQEKELNKLEAEKKLFELQSKNKNIYFSATIIILLLLVTFYLWRYILKRKSEKKLSLQYNILLDTEDRIKALLDASFDSTLLVDSNYIILTANNNNLNGFFKKPDQLTSQNILHFFTKENKNILIHFLALVSKTKLSKEFVLHEKNNVQLNIRISPIINANKKISTLAFYIKDITLIEKAKSDQKNMEKKLIQTQKMETIGTLAGGIAHDFNNYLATINGYVNMLLEDTDKNSNSYRYLTNSQKALKQAKNTVKKLLAFSRTNELTFAPTTLNELFIDSLDMIKGLKPKNIDLIYPDTLPEYPLFIDTNQITQVIINICTNAFHAIGDNPNGKLEFTFSNYKKQENKGSTKMIRIQIKDNGIGMEQATVNRVFEPFFTTKEVGKGTGLGLSVASGIIKQHNGEISVISEYNIGTTFHIILPIKNQIKNN